MMKIEITAEAGSMRKTIDEAMATLGFIRAVERAVIGEALSGTSLLSHDEFAAQEQEWQGDSAAAADTPETQAGAVSGAVTEQPVSSSGRRERGKPGSGRARRTKEEMAEDAAADARDAAAGVPIARETPQITANPEARVGPQDSPEVQAQDAADEQAESAANRKALTLDDVRDAVGRYYAKYGMGPATADIQAIFGCKLHEIPDSVEAFGKAIAAVDQATADNPYGRAVIAAMAAEPTKAGPTLDDLKVVMGRYIQTFGEAEGYADLPKILGIDSIKLLPADPVVYAAKIKTVEEAIEANPFGRKVVG